MDIVLSILMASMPATSDHICWMIDDGQIINLGQLCGEEQGTASSSTLNEPLISSPQSLSPSLGGAEEAFLLDLQTNLSPIAIAMLEEIDAIDFALDYCSARSQGITEVEYSGYFQYGVSLGLDEQPVLSTEEEVVVLDVVSEFYDAVTTYGPRHFCPEFQG